MLILSGAIDEVSPPPRVRSCWEVGKLNPLLGGGVSAEEPREDEGLNTSWSDKPDVGLKDWGDSLVMLSGGESGGLSAVDPSKSLKPGGGMVVRVDTIRLLERCCCWIVEVGIWSC